MSESSPVRDGIALVSIGSAVVEASRSEARARFLRDLDAAVSDGAVRAVVVHGAWSNFCMEPDVEVGPGRARHPPDLRHLVTAIEECAKPVVATIEGDCLNGAFELALACHHRVAWPGARVGFPEVAYGRIPGAGGTQRLPRIVGLTDAINLIARGVVAEASSLQHTALFDAIADDALQAAVTLAAERADAGAPPARVRDRSVVGSNVEAFCQFARNAVAAALQNNPAPRCAIDALQASTGDFDAGIVRERELFDRLAIDPISRALRHGRRAMDAAASIRGLPDSTPTREVVHVAVIGGGTMGCGIALAFLAAGLRVTLLERDQEALDRGIARVRETIEAQMAKRRLTPQAGAAQLAALAPALAYDAIGGCDLAIEAVFEDMAVKEDVFRRLDSVMKAGAILATNTSTLDVNRIAAITKRPSDVIGLHFFSPANVMRLLEVVRGAKTASDVLATAMRLARGIGKIAVVAGVCDGFIGNRMLLPYCHQAEHLLEEGASPGQIDRALERFGFAMGPFRMFDMAGNDIGAAIRQRQRHEHPERCFPTALLRLCEAGRLGQKSGRGWYDYAPGDRTARPAAEVDDLLAALRRETGIEPRRIDECEIVDRLVLALVNEGARILEEGISQSASDIDVVYLTGYGFPAWRGGPMFHADTTGLYQVVRRMRDFARNPLADPDFWRPAPLLARLAASGDRFEGDTV